MILEKPTRLYETLIDEIEKRYRAWGYTVMRKPQEDVLPQKFYGYRPDVIATKRGAQSLAFEVWEDSERHSIYSLTDISRMVASVPNWRLVLVAGDAIGDTLGAQLLDEKEIQRRLSALRKPGQDLSIESRYVLLWILYESVLRNRAVLHSVPVESLNTRALLDHMYSLGELWFDHYEMVLPLFETYELLVHGFRSEQATQQYPVLEEIVEATLHEDEPERVLA